MTAVTALATLTAATRSGLNPAALLVIGVIFGLLAYFLARNYRERNGVTPWNMPAWLWGLIGFISLLLWAILYIIATRTTKKRMATMEPPYPSYPPASPYGGVPGTPYGAAPGAPGPYGTAPGSPAPYGTPPGGPAPYGTPEGQAAGAPRTASGPPPYPTAAPLPPPGWYPDPSGRHQSRYWDGDVWTEHVSDGSATSTDPV